MSLEPLVAMNDFFAISVTSARDSELARGEQTFPATGGTLKPTLAMAMGYHRRQFDYLQRRLNPTFKRRFKVHLRSRAYSLAPRILESGPCQ